MSALELPAPSSLLPHAPPMLLLDRVLAHSADETVCRAAPQDGSPFRDADGRVPAWVGIELMAQCMAVHGGLAGLLVGSADGDRRRPPALFVGARHLVFRDQALELGVEHRVSARPLERRGRLVSFACSVAVVRVAGTQEPLLEGTLSAFLAGP